jgi:hypothetical protein
VRRLTLLLSFAVVVIGVLAGCGSSTSGAGTGAATPLLRDLSYFPSTSPFVVTVATRPTSQSATQLQALERRFPTYSLAATAVFAEMAKLGIDYNRDIRPLFGNPIAFGLPSATGASASSAPFLAVWVTRSATHLKAVVAKLPGLHATGTHDGASLYAVGHYAAGVLGPTLLLAGSDQVLDQALDRHAHGQGFTAAAYAAATSGVASDGAVEVVGDLSQVLTAPSAASARQVPWVAALRGYAASISASATGLTVRFRLDTTGRALTPAQLPIASGTTSPGVAGTLPVQAGVRDPAQVIDFMLAAVRQGDPKDAADLSRNEARLKGHGIDVPSAVALLSGNLQIESDGHATLARVGVSDAGTARALLTKLARPGTGPHGPALIPAGRGFYTIAASKPAVTLGLSGDELLVGRATAAQLRAFGSAPVAAATGAGSANLRIALGELLAMTLRHAPSAIEQQMLGVVGDLTGSASATTGGVSGILTLALR